MATTTNTPQLRAEHLYKKNHSFLILGHAGCGKTTTLVQLLLSEPRRKHAVVTPTGLCALNLPPVLQPQTIHHRFGLLDGRFTKEQLN